MIPQWGLWWLTVVRYQIKLQDLWQPLGPGKIYRSSNKPTEEFQLSKMDSQQGHLTLELQERGHWLEAGVDIEPKADGNRHQEPAEINLGSVCGQGRWNQAHHEPAEINMAPVNKPGSG